MNAFAYRRGVLHADGVRLDRLADSVGTPCWVYSATELERRYREFTAMLPDYAMKCNGEGGMGDTIMLFAALGWDAYAGEAEQLCDYFPSSGSGQINVEFHVS